MRRSPLVYTLSVIFFIGALSAWYLYNSPDSPESYAKAIVSKCAGTADRPFCYEEEVPRLLSRGVSFEDAFEVAYAIQKLDASGEYCHSIGHRLGAVEVAKDPSKWKEVARRTPLGQCLSGGLHGAFQERFRMNSLPPQELESFAKEMHDFCSVRDDMPSSPVDLSMCAHGLGHLFVFVTDGEVKRALSLCPAVLFEDGGGVTAEGQELSCFDGLFMQLFEPHEPEDHALIKGREQTRDTVGEFCAGFSGLPRAACIARSAPFFYKDLSSGAPKPLDCNVLETERRRSSCLSTQLRLFSRDTFFNLDATDDYCATYPADKRGWCYASAGSFAFMAGYDYEQPFRFCSRAVELGAGDQCFETLAHLIPYTFREDDPSRGELCGRLPEPHLTSCLAARK